MAACKNIRRKKRRVCIGDLDELITLQDRDIASPIFGSVDFGEDFSADNVVWAMIETVKGGTIFDGVEEADKLTHKFYIIFDASVTAETWIVFGSPSRRFDILDVENLDERNEFMLLSCADRGLASQEASKA